MVGIDIDVAMEEHRNRKTGNFVKIKFIKETELKKVGEIVNCSKKSAESAINSGYAEYIHKETESTTATPDYSKLNDKLEEIFDLRPVEQTPKIEEVAKEFNCSVSEIKDELKQFEKRQKDNLKIERDKEKVEDKKHKEELKILSQERKTEEKAEMQKEKEKVRQQEEARKNLAKQEVKSRMESDFSFKIVNLLATKQENEATELCSKKAQEKHKFYSTKSDGT